MPRPPDNPDLEDDDLGDFEAPTIQVDTMYPDGVPDAYVAPAELETLSPGEFQDAEEEPSDATQIAPMLMPETVVEAPAETVSTSRGPRIGRYTLRKRLGVGGMAEVFQAEQDGPAGFRKQVVVKRILPQLTASPKFIELFLREARLAATLNHSNIVQIYELGEDEGQYFIAMEYVDGATLHQLAKICWHFHKPLPFELIVGPIADAALGLHHAHNLRDSEGRPAGLVHRDISPDNLMLTRDGVTKILDFGVAKGLASADGSTRVGELKGKIPFMAPEVIQGRTLDGRADLYALGVCMYWLLTGHRPHSADNDAELLDAVLKIQPASTRSLNPTVPVELDAVVMSLLSKDREQRPGSGEALHDILNELMPAPPRMIAPFIKQVLAWGADLAAGKQAGERPRTFVPAGPSSLYSAGAPGIPGVGVARPVVTPSSLSPSPISDLRQMLSGGIAQQTFESPGPTQPAMPRASVDVELADQLADEGISLEDLEADAAMSANTVSTSPSSPTAMGSPTYAPNTQPSLHAANTAPNFPTVSTDPQADIGALLADTLDELGGSTRSVLTGPMDLPLDFKGPELSRPDQEFPKALTTGSDKPSVLLQPRTWFIAGALLGLLVVAVIWFSQNSGAQDPGLGGGSTGDQPGGVVVPAGGRPDAAGVAVDRAQGALEFDPAQLKDVDAGQTAAAAITDAGATAAVVDAAVPANAAAGDAGAVAAVTPDAGRGREVSTPKTPVQGRFVSVRGPKNIRWLDNKQKFAGRGNDKLHLPRSATYIFAVDTRRQVTTRIPLKGDETVDYTRLPRGKLAVRAFPFAIVTLGSEKVGTTPFAPIDLVVGSYKVTLQHEQTTKVMTVEVQEGQTATLKANMTE